MISDFVKGKQRFAYAPGVQLGIILHREIDNFTDTHPAVKTAREIFRPAYRLYSAPLLDVVLDHFLAVDENEFSREKLADFAAETYYTISGYEYSLPEKFKHLFYSMKTQNWLGNYQYRWGIEKSLGGLVHRARYLEDSSTAFRLFNEQYHLLQTCYGSFFPEVKKIALNFLHKHTGFHV